MNNGYWEIKIIKMKNTILIDSHACKKCGVCMEICPNGIFTTDNNTITVKPEREALCFACGQCMAVCSEKAIQVEGLSYDKDFFDLPGNTDIEPAFTALTESRRSVRSFKDMAIPKDKLEQVVKAISLAPPSFPPLKTEIVVVQDRQLIQQALPYMVQLYDNLMNGLKNPIGRFIVRKKVGAEKLRVIQNHVVPMFNIKLPFMKNRTEDAITRNAQAIILFHADKQADNYKADIYIAMTYALLKAHSLGIGATAVDLIPPAVERVPYLRQLFKIPDQNEVVASVILGYPKYKYKRAIKRELKSVTWV